LGVVIITFLFFKGSLEKKELKGSRFKKCSREIYVYRYDNGDGVEMERCIELGPFPSEDINCLKRKYKYKKLDGTEIEKELCIHKPIVKYLGLKEGKPTIHVVSKAGHNTLSTDEIDIFLGKDRKPEFIFMNLGNEICTRPINVDDRINSCRNDQRCYDSATGKVIKMWVLGNSECKKIIVGW
jgi:hypothetical protein